MVLLRRVGALVAATLGAFAFPAAAGEALQASGEAAVKAAFLYNFTRFVEWPERALAGSASFDVCTLADGEFRQALRETLANEQVRGRPMRVVELAPGDDPSRCHIVYFGPRHGELSGRQLPALRQIPVLTVGEGPVFVKQGGMIGFLLENNRVRFDVSKRAADAAGLVVSSKLLRVAREVHEVRAP
jgi:hypothetical protein